MSSIVEKLEAINPARERCGIFAVVARFVGAEDLRDVGVAVSVARSFSFEETVLHEIGVTERDVFLGSKGFGGEAGVLRVSNRGQVRSRKKQ